MLNKFSTRLANWLFKNNVISSDDIDVQIYGITAVICTVSNYLILFVLAILFHRIIEALIFLLFYMILRNYIGGWHATTPLRCTIIGTTLLCFYMFLAEFLPTKIWSGILLSIAATVLIFLYAPSYIDKDYTATQLAYFKQKSRIIALIMLGIIILTSLLSFWEYHTIFQKYAGTGMFSAVLTMLPVRFCKIKSKN